MEGILAVLAGVVAVALSPLVPVLRPAAKAAVKGGMVVADAAVKGGAAVTGAATGTAVVVGQQWDRMVSSINPDETAAAVSASVEDGASSDQVATAPAQAATADEPLVEAETRGAEAAAAELPAVKPPDTAAETFVPEQQAATATPELHAMPGGGADVDDMTPSADDLSQIDGIGAKTAQVLAAAGITTFAQLAAASVEQLQEILSTAGPRYRGMNPNTWPEQAHALE